MILQNKLTISLTSGMGKNEKIKWVEFRKFVSPEYLPLFGKKNDNSINYYSF